MRNVVFVTTAGDIPEARADTLVIVLDPGWTPTGDDRPDVLGVRAVLGPIVAQVDVVEEALQRVDDWAADVGLPDRLVAEGVTYWYRMRETMWRWLHERLQWAHALERLGLAQAAITFHVPRDEDAIDDVVGTLGATLVRLGEEAPATGSTGRAGAELQLQRRGMRRWLGGLRKRLVPVRARVPDKRPVPSERAISAVQLREQVLDERVRRLAASPADRFVVLTTPATYQRVGAVGGGSHDPNLGPVVERLIDDGGEVVLVGLGLDAARDEDWAVVEANPAMLPFSHLRSRWGGAEDKARATDAVALVDQSMRAIPSSPSLTFGSVDFHPAATEKLRTAALDLIRIEIRQRPRIERFLEELRPRAIVLTQEGIRLPWLMACRATGVPSFALQHGVLYPGHAGYPNRRHPRLLLPDRTFVYGDYERRVLVDELAYEPSEVEVSGSPRLDLDAGAPRPVDERASIRSALGVGDGDRLLVVSTVHLRFFRRSHLAHMLERTLGGPLPGVHVVFKQHPGERDTGFYRELLDGLAVAGGYEPPPVTVVRDIDLMALLRAADAHLGGISTVLTDAVSAGTHNLIATADAHRDLLGYVSAGVAQPVNDVADVLAQLDSPTPVDPARRDAFLADHFRPGSASGRIVASIRAEVPSQLADPVPLEG